MTEYLVEAVELVAIAYLVWRAHRRTSEQTETAPRRIGQRLGDRRARLAAKVAARREARSARLG